MSEEFVYVVGHKSPDLDSVAGAIAYAHFKNIKEKTNIYKAFVAGPLNKEAEYVLNKFEVAAPREIETLEGKKVIMIDHNEFSQSVKGIEEAQIIEVLDHHKVGFSYSSPILFRSLPWGSSCSIITQDFKDNNIPLDKKMAGIMLSAILVDTVITKSPTCTNKDIEIINYLSQKAGIEDWQAFGIELFKIRSNVNKLEAEEIIKGDFKDFNFKQGKIGTGQVETVDLKEFDSRQEDILNALERIKEKEGYHSVILFITDIMKEGSLFLVASDDKDKLGQVFGSDFGSGKAFVEGIMSRKKQVAPKIEKAFN